MRKIFMLLSYVVVGVGGAVLNIDTVMFTDFIKAYDKRYDNNSLFYRYNVFSQNLEKIREHNMDDSNTWKMELNEYADLTSEEFKNMYTGYNKDLPKNNKIPRITLSYNNLIRNTPSQLDWTDLGAVTPIKNQGKCGSCWSFSATGGVEGAYFLKNNKLKSFSEQQLVDCSGKYGNEGCQGGLMDNAFNYIESNGICLEDDYKYKGKQGTCKKCKSVTNIKSYVDVPENDEEALLKALTIQPISVAIEADQSLFQFYSSGVLTGKCGTNLDHGVLLTGYGTSKDGIDYWKVKNSWGEEWGDNGYILLERNVKAKEGQCGIAMSASYPVL
jgi:C1A family cysteine protease